MAAASTPLGSPSNASGVTHPLYLRWRDQWVKYLDVFEGAGGFLDSTKPYLIAHPREWLDHSIPTYADDGVTVTGYIVNTNPTQPSPKLLERRKLARYENVAATLVDQLCGALFRVKADRSFAADAPAPEAERPIETFWADADGLGTSWDDVLMESWKPCAAFGHLWVYMDVLEDGRPVPRFYTPLDVPDWLVDETGRLVAVKFSEAVPREEFKKLAASSVVNIRTREVRVDGWTLYDGRGKTVAQGTHDYDGVLPVYVWYAKRRALTPFIGRSVLGDPQLYIDLYNLISETRELLRKQTFSIVNVPIGDAPGGVQREQELIGRQSGTGNLLFSTNPAQMLSADASNVTVYHEHMDRLTRLIYRLSVVAWEGDSKEAETAESRRIKREDLNQQLAAYADECRRLDAFVTDMVYRIAYGAAWETWREKDGLTLRWPDSFEVTPLEELTKQFSDAIALDLGETATKEIKKRAVRAVLPDVGDETQAAMDGEIDAMDVVSQEEIRQEELQARTQRLAGAFGG